MPRPLTSTLIEHSSSYEKRERRRGKRTKGNTRGETAENTKGENKMVIKQERTKWDTKGEEDNVLHVSDYGRPSISGSGSPTKCRSNKRRMDKTSNDKTSKDKTLNGTKRRMEKKRPNGTKRRMELTSNGTKGRMGQNVDWKKR
jgi:hypothetical protein